jgi:hypothetical protein
MDEQEKAQVILQARIDERSRILRILGLSKPATGLWAWTIAFMSDLTLEEARTRLVELEQTSPPLSEDSVVQVVQAWQAARQKRLQ